jgi:tRNA(adenine34) deaminase
MDSDEIFMQAALDEAARALEQHEFPVGCVLVAGSQIVASGGRRNSSGNPSELDHAEIVALRAYREKTLVSDLPVTAYSTMEPCLMCYATLLLSGIRRFVYAFEDPMGGGTSLPLGELRPLYQEMEVEIIGGVLRAEAMALFKAYYAKPENSYLRGTLLANHIMGQKGSDPF